MKHGLEGSNLQCGEGRLDEQNEALKRFRNSNGGVRAASQCNFVGAPQQKGFQKREGEW